jgi:Kef-type K+ transport system membrane component KefB
VTRGRRRPVPRAWHLLVILLTSPALLHASSEEQHLPQFLLVIAAMLMAGKLLGEVTERFGLPSVLGELTAGVLLGPSLLGIIPATGEGSYELVRVLGELGVILLLFEVGLETDLKEMTKVGGAALAVACVGVVLPFALGYLFWAKAPHPMMGDGGDLITVAIFVGATLTATSVGITARVLGDLGQMETPEARVILGAAVMDDVIGLVILSVVSGIAAGGEITVGGVSRTFIIAAGFLVVAVAVGNYLLPPLTDRVVGMRVRGIIVAMAIAFALALAAFAAQVGSAMIIGAFAAGLILRSTRHAHAIEQQVQPVAALLSPIFFVSVGAAADVRLLDPRAEGAGGLLLVAGALTLLAIVGKVAAGWAAPWTRMNRLMVGVGMVPRGEVGLIFADVGRRAGLLSDATFSAVLLMVMATTFLAPVVLKLLAGRRAAA